MTAAAAAAAAAAHRVTWFTSELINVGHTTERTYVSHTETTHLARTA